jgi:hypothetical protein
LKRRQFIIGSAAALAEAAPCGTACANVPRPYSFARSDIYNGRIVLFVPFTDFEGDVIAGTHNK